MLFGARKLPLGGWTPSGQPGSGIGSTAVTPQLPVRDSCASNTWVSAAEAEPEPPTANNTTSTAAHAGMRAHLPADTPSFIMLLPFPWQTTSASLGKAYGPVKEREWTFLSDGVGPTRRGPTPTPSWRKRRSRTASRSVPWAGRCRGRRARASCRPSRRSRAARRRCRGAGGIRSACRGSRAPRRT